MLSRLGLLALVLLAFGLACLWATPALAGANANGALIVHTNDLVGWYYRYTYCRGAMFDDPIWCENANTRTDRTPGGDPAVIWFFAALPDTSHPVVREIDFGTNHNLTGGQSAFTHWQFCGDASTFEETDPGWPWDPNAGCRLSFGSPIVGDRLFVFYFFVVEAESWESYFGSSVHPGLGYAAFHDDSNPPVLDPIEGFGVVQWGEDGYNDCPGSGPPEACCFDDGHCEILPTLACEGVGGSAHGTDVTCDPNPCPPPTWGACCMPDAGCSILYEDECSAMGGVFVGGACSQSLCYVACCFPDLHCEIHSLASCEEHGGTPLEPGSFCVPNPCIPTAQQPTTWGRVRGLYR